MDFQKYIKQKKEEYNHLIGFVESESDDEVLFKNISEEASQKINNLPPKEKKSELKLFLRLVSSICNNHYRNANFQIKFEKIILFFQNIIQQTLTIPEIFDIFKDNKQILLFLFKHQIIEYNNQLIKDTIYSNQGYLSFFYPEIKEQLNNEEKERIEKNLISDDSSIFSNFDEKRQNGENDSYICQLIRQDSIEDFKSHVSKTNLSLDSKIKNSIFETNRFLFSKKSVSLIEYAAFFGSLKIFHFLREKSVKMTPSLWLYSIHGQKIELIQFLKENNIEPNDETFCECYKEAIKCHHNQIADYIEKNLLTQKDDIKCIEKVVQTSFCYCNFSSLPEDLSPNSAAFFFACKYDYQILLEILLNMKKLNIE